MTDTVKSSDLDGIIAGDHSAYLYRDINEQVEVLFLFINAWIEQGKKVFVIIDREAKLLLFNSQVDEQHNIIDYCTSGQLVIEDVFSQLDFNTNPIRAIQNSIKRELTHENMQGYSSLKVAIDMSNLVTLMRDEANSSVVEKIIDSVLDDKQHSVLFLYSQQTIETNHLLNLISNHPCIFINGKTYRDQEAQFPSSVSMSEQFIRSRFIENKKGQTPDSIYRSIIEISPIGVALFDNQGRLQEANQSFWKMCGKTSTLANQNIRFEELFSISEEVKNQLARGEFVRTEIIFFIDTPQKNRAESGQLGEHLHFEAIITPFQSQAKDKSRGLIIQVQDQTKLKRLKAREEINRQQLEGVITLRTKELAQTVLDLEKEISKRQQITAFLVESEQRYRALVDGSPAPILVVQDEKFIFGNQAAIKMLGYPTSNELVGKSILSVIDPAYQKDLSKKISITKGRKKNSPKLVKIHRSDGSIIYFESAVVPIVFSGKSAYLMIGYDVTERINTENALKQSEETSITLINAIQDAFYLLNPDGTVITANDEGIRRLNLKSNILVGADITSSMPPKATKIHLWNMDKVLHSGKPAIYEARHKQKILENTIYPIFDDRKQIVRLALYSRDVSDHVRTEKALQRHAEEIEALNRTFLEITTHMDLSTLLHLIVIRAATLLGESSGGLYMVHPEKELLELVVSYNLNLDYTGICLKLGEGLSGKIAQTGQPMFQSNYSTWEEKAAVYHNLAIRRVIGVPLKVAGKVIGVITVSSSQKTSPYNEEEIRLVSLFADQAAIAIENTRLLETAQHELAERIQITQALKASLAEKEVMLREIHHRVKNNLNVIIALLDLQGDSSKTSSDKPLFDDLKSRVRTMALVHENLYQSADLGQVDFANYIKKLTEYLLASYASELPIQLDIDIPSIPMSIDTAIPCGLIVNELVTNAIKYAFPLKKWTLLFPQKECHIQIKIYEENDQLSLLVSDNGIGISPDIDWQVTNTLGLLLVSTLTNQLNGTIEKIPGEGTTFIIRFKRKS